MSTTAVDSAAAQMASTSLNDTANSAEATNVAAGTEEAQAEAISASAAEGRRLYIGNLAYATTEGELKEFFKDYLVETASIPTNPRTTRPVGYAFVDLSTPSEAERAIAELNGKTVLERKVSVQLARRPDADGAGSGGEGDIGGARRRSSGRGRGRGRGRGGRFGRSGRNRNGKRAEGEEGDEAPVNVPGQADPLTNTTNDAQDGEGGVDGTGKGGKPRVPRERKQRGPPEDGIPSKTKVMVANLPYDLKEDKLLEIFKDYQPTAAKIALRPIPRFMVKKLQARNEPRKGRGFGFVTLGSEEMQLKACAEMNGKQIGGRDIAVKVAIDSPGKEDEDGNMNGEDAGENGNAAPVNGTEQTTAA